MKFALSVFMTCAVCFSVAGAQETGQITGTVRDSSGAAIVKAEVTASSHERGIERATQTNSTGEYAISALPPGTYDLTIKATGFATYSANGIVLPVAEKVRADVTLKVGAKPTEVTVQGTSVGAVETQSTELSGVITGKQISQLELNGRN